jgi:hypothetical protein
MAAARGLSPALPPAIQCPDHAIARLGEVFVQKVYDIQVIVDGQRTLVDFSLVGRLFLVGGSSAPHRKLSWARAKRDGDGEGRAHSNCTLHREVSTQEPGEPTADRQAQTGTLAQDAQGVMGVTRALTWVSRTPNSGGYIGVFPHFTPTYGIRRQRETQHPIAGSGAA